MTPEQLAALQESIRQLNERFGKLNGMQERLASLEGALRAPDATEVTIRAELETLTTEATELRSSIADIQQRQRTSALLMDPASSEREAFRMFGMQVRQGLCRRLQTEAPSAFRAEGDALRTYMEQRATLNADATGGSNLVPTIMEHSIFDTLEEVSSLLALTDFQPNLPGKMDIPTLITRPTLQHKRASIDTDMTQSDPGIGSVSFDPDEMYIYFPIDNRLIEMSAIALGTLAFQLLRDGVAEGLVNDLLNADGTSTYNGMTGFLQESTAAYVYSMTTGASTDAFTDLAAADLQGCVAKALRRGRANGRWIMAQDVFFNITNIDREGKVPLVSYGNDGMPRILGAPVEIDEGMPTIADSAAATPFIGYGDLRTYLVGLVNGVKIDYSTDVLFKRNQTAFRAVLNGDIVRKPVATFITLKSGATS
jgi:HK97 family phage major capsid protein